MANTRKDDKDIFTPEEEKKVRDFLKAKNKEGRKIIPSQVFVDCLNESEKD